MAHSDAGRMRNRLGKLRTREPFCHLPRQQDFELQGGSWFVFEAPITVRYQQRQELMPLLWCDFNCGNDRKPGHARCSFAAYHLDAARLLRALVVLSKTLRAMGPVRNAAA